MADFVPMNCGTFLMVYGGNSSIDRANDECFILELVVPRRFPTHVTVRTDCTWCAGSQGELVLCLCIRIGKILMTLEGYPY